ncbi:MAG: hypothetical protein U0Q11_10240 [Vicinamibacterales bacterium]
MRRWPLAAASTRRPVSTAEELLYLQMRKGYQISRCPGNPLASEGLVAFDGLTLRRVRITRVHMEEDAGKSLHEGFRRLRPPHLSRLQPGRHTAHRDRD